MKALILIITIGISGCMISRYSSEADILSINRAMVSGRSISFLTKNGKEYELNVTYMDSVKLTGIGRYIDSSNSEWKGYKGDISLDSIDLVLINKYNVGKTIFTVGSGVALISLFSEAVKGKDPPELIADIEYTNTGPNQGGGGGSSCPFIYSWNGSGWAIEGEAIGTAFGKALEMQTGTILHSLEKQNGIIKARITNERPETHYINMVSCTEYYLGEHTIVCMDNCKKIWPVNNLTAPVHANDNSTESILNKVNKVDQQNWKSRLQNITIGSDFRDEIELTFHKPDPANEASLVVNAINTHFSETVFQNIFGFLGTKALDFMHAVENDPEMIELMKDWLEKSALQVDIWNGSEWQIAGRIQPEANRVPFAKLIRIPLRQNEKNEIRVKLSCLADVWEIDGIFMDFSDVKPLTGMEIPIVNAVSAEKLDVNNTVQADDDNYEILLPGDNLDLTFKDPSAAEAGKDKVYVLNVKGYLHEWIIEPDDEPAMHSLSTLRGIDKISFIKQILSKNDMFLPLVYSDWIKKRN